LWLIQAAEEDEDGESRRAAMAEMFKEVLSEPESPVSLARLVMEARR
jgi:hypothetical protein